MLIEIEPTRNGAVLRCKEEGLDEPEKTGYKFDRDDPEELANMFYDIIEYLGVNSSRYAKKRISISVVHGDKLDCEGCNLCKP